MKMTPKTKKIAKVLSVMAVMAVMFATSTIIASAAGGAPAAPAAGGGDNSVATYTNVMNLILAWIRRAGAAVGLIGAIMFALAIKNDDPDRRQTGLFTMISGFAVCGICLAAGIFGLFD